MLQMRRMLVVQIVVAVLACATVVSAQDLQVFVPMDDGVGLATDVYLPFGLGPWSTILVRTTYGKDGFDEGAQIAAFLGYSVVVQDTRGRFDSQGVDTVFRDDRSDGQATLRWIASQVWSNGRIGTFGGSALGITQYMLAPGAGAELVCMMPLVATPDVYQHAFYQGGAVREALVVNWLDGQGSLDMLPSILEHRTRDDWWDPVNALADRAEVEAPALHIGGWYDVFAQGTLDGFSELQAAGGPGARGNQHLVMGPWTHGSIGESEAGELVYPETAALDPIEALTDWFDYWLGDEDSGVDDWPAVRVFLMGAAGEPQAPGNEWVDLATWPPLSQPLSLYLGSEGVLSFETAAPGDAELLIDPEDPVPTLGGANLFPDLQVDGRAMGDGPWDQRSIEARDDVLVFSTPVLDEPLTVMGRITVRLWVDADTPDLDLAARLSDVYPDGRSMLVVDGIRRARSRCGDQVECLLTPGVPTEIEVDLWSTALVFNAGHRIRISISGSNHPRFELNPNHGGPIDGDEPARVARPSILYGGEYPSALVLPVPLPPRRPAGRAGWTADKQAWPPAGVTVDARGDVPPGEEGAASAHEWPLWLMKTGPGS